MENEKQKITTLDSSKNTKNNYDDGNIPREDLARDVIPDEVPRKDGPGGEGENE